MKVGRIVKYSLIAVACIIIVLAITNPSLKQFKERIGERSWKYYDVVYKRTSNWIIFSTYQFSYTTNEKYEYEESSEKTAILDKLTGEYTGFFSNFYKK